MRSIEPGRVHDGLAREPSQQLIRLNRLSSNRIRQQQPVSAFLGHDVFDAVQSPLGLDLGLEELALPLTTSPIVDNEWRVRIRAIAHFQNERSAHSAPLQLVSFSSFR